jgi:hypothetical protein
MSKAKSDNLFRLISSLSKSEKRMFKLLASRTGAGDKKFIRLFDIVESQREYDETQVLKKAPELKPHQMPNMKAHLYKQILKCLQITSTNKLPEIKITEMIDYARILYSKCLYRECLKMIDKAKKRAVESDSHLLLLELLELEKMVAFHRENVSYENKAIKIIKETSTTSQSIHNINLFSNLSLQLNSLYQNIGFIRDKKDLEKAAYVLHTSLPKYSEQQLTFHEKLYLYYSYTGYYFFTQNFKDGYKYAQKWLGLFEEEPKMQERKTEMYIKALNSVLVAQNKLFLYHDFMSTHRKLVALKRSKKVILTENIKLHLFKAIYIHEINRHFMLGEFKSGSKIVSGLRYELNNFIPRLDKHTVLLFYYKIACLYIGSSNFNEALKWLSKIINDKEIHLREDLHSFARILRLVCYFELGDDDAVEYHIRSTYRFLSKKKSFVGYLNLIIAFLKGIRMDYSTSEVISRFIYFDIISWLESKIDGRPIQDVVKEKVALKIRLSLTDKDSTMLKKLV